MPQLIAMVLRWIVHKLWLLLLIIAILLVGSRLKAEWDQHRAIQQALGSQQALLEGLQSELASIDVTLAADAAEWRRQSAERLLALWTELDALNDRAEAAESESQRERGAFLDLTRQAQSARRAAGVARVELAALEQDSWWWDKYLHPEKVAALVAARAKYAALDRTARAAESASRHAATAAVELRKQLVQLEQRRAALQQTIKNPSNAVSPRQASLSASRDRKQREIAAAAAVLDAQHTQVTLNPRERLIETIRSRIPAALGILLGVMLTPILIKAVFYFVIAPVAGRLRPIRILPGEPTATARPGNSAVSAPIDIPPGFELLVHPDFLQSSSQPAIKRTQWLLNARLPIASLASSMYALTRIRPQGDTSTRVVVSALKDPFGEVAKIELPEGAAMVIQPRSLAGMLKPAGTPAHITRHWRLGSLHAWLTLQLRYLVFHGPCQLILKGCRGVRAEEPRADEPRLINQAATLGFSANLDYRTIRCETFVPYLRGREDLFNDLFAGAPGWFVYEEMPARDRKAGVTGRGLEGITDAILKVFGI